MMLESFAQIDWTALAGAGSALLIWLATAALLLVVAALTDDEESNIPAAISGLGIAAAFFAAWRLWPEAAGAAPQLMLVFDRMTAVGWMISAIAAAFSLLLAIPYLKARGRARHDFFALLMLAAFGMGALAAGTDLISILLGLEVMSLAAYALTGYLKERAASIEGAIKYFLMGAFATAFFAMGIAFLFGSTGTTDIATIGARAPDIASGGGRAFFLFGCSMVIVGFAFKVAAVPFHAWAPDAYDGAPTPVASFMATGIKAAAFIAFLRFIGAIAPAAGILWHHLAWGLAAITMIVGNLAAIRQDNLKRMLAYSSIAHAGYILVAFPSIAANPKAGSSAILLYLFAYVVVTAGAFAAVTAIGLAPGEPVEVAGIAGLAKRRPALAAAFTLFLVSLAGFPPTLGFFGKYYLFLAAVSGGDVILVCIALLASVVSAYYYLRPVVAMYFHEGRPGAAAPSAPLSPAIVAALIITAMAAILFGIAPQNLVALVQGSGF